MVNNFVPFYVKIIIHFYDITLENCLCSIILNMIFNQSTASVTGV